MDMVDVLRLQEIGRGLIAVGVAILVSAPIIFTADRTIARVVAGGRRGIAYVKSRYSR